MKKYILWDNTAPAACAERVGGYLLDNRVVEIYTFFHFLSRTPFSGISLGPLGRGRSVTVTKQ